LVQQLAVENNLKAFREVLSKRSNWSNVPEDRFKRRVDFLKP
jgi:hypothetical protein